MEKRMSAALDLCEDVMTAYEKKSKYSVRKTLILALLSGMFIAVGAYASSIAAYSFESSSAAKIASAVAFPIGLVLIIIIGTDLFTGNTLMLVPMYDKRVTANTVVKNLTMVFLGNLVGAVLISLLVYLTGVFNTNEHLIDYALKVASNKTSLSPVNVLFSGIGCNLLVCGTIWMSIAAKDIIGKSFISFFGIFVFVITGFEHCVANMYYLSISLFIKADPNILALSTLAQDKIDKITIPNVLMNLLFSTTGNILGGGVLLGGLLYMAFVKEKH